MFAWRDVGVTRVGNITTWTIDGFLIATVTNNAALNSGAIDIGYWDPSASIGTSGWSFGVIDNIIVTQIPEPSTIALAALGTASVFTILRRRRNCK